MFKLYLALCVLRIIAFYYLVWTVAHTSATYIVEKKEIEGRTNHLIKNKTLIRTMVFGLVIIVCNLGISKFGEKVYAEEQAKEELASRLDYEKNFTRKNHTNAPQRQSSY